MSRARINQMKKMRHAQLIRRRISFGLMTVMLVMVLALTGFHMTAKATEQDTADAVKYYTSIQIEPGDSLWSIANTYMDDHYDSINDYIKDIAKANGISIHTSLTSGEFLIIPYYIS
jgi:cell division protein YceG involved in septum cleavage